jgi:hypothetical protein
VRRATTVAWLEAGRAGQRRGSCARSGWALLGRGEGRETRRGPGVGSVVGWGAVGATLGTGRPSRPPGGACWEEREERNERRARVGPTCE